MMLWATEASTLAVLMIGAWFYDRRLVVTGLWGLGFALHGGGILLVALRGIIPDLVSIVGGNGLALVGVACWCNGMLVYDERRPTALVLIPLGMWLSALTVPAIMAHFWARTSAFQISGATAYLIFAAIVFAGRRKAYKARIVLAGVACVQAGLMLKMAYDSLHLRPAGFLEMPNVASYAVGNIFCLVAGILLGAKLLMARSEAHLQRLADSDPLTGVFNRRGLLDRFQQLCRKTTGAKSHIAIVLFDLDHFKQINDRHGHKAGDVVLTEFCRIATTCLGERGIFGRMGGEEFACMMQVGGPPEAIGVTEAIRLTLEHTEIRIAEGDAPIPVTVSCGIALSPLSSADLDAMLISADRALYAAKFAGRNGTALATGTGDDIQLIGPGFVDPAAEEREVTPLKRHALVPIIGGRI